MSRYSERHTDGRSDTSRTVTVLEPVDQSPPASRDNGTPPCTDNHCDDHARSAPVW